MSTCRQCWQATSYSWSPFSKRDVCLCSRHVDRITRLARPSDVCPSDPCDKKLPDENDPISRKLGLCGDVIYCQRLRGSGRTGAYHVGTRPLHLFVNHCARFYEHECILHTVNKIKKLRHKTATEAQLWTVGRCWVFAFLCFQGQKIQELEEEE